ncbi:MAG: ATP-binding protein, partial [Spirochaetes bacterium]|nr:ATP-binding protein [Spirochaetota bacterium]
MLTHESILDLIKNDENHIVEFKNSEYIKGKKNSELAKSMASFSNHKGGVILIGVNDDKTIEGFRCNGSEAKKHEELVYQIAANNCKPPILPDFSKVELNEGIIFVIEISETPNEPIRANGKFYIRHGNGTRELTSEELKEKYAAKKTVKTTNKKLMTSFENISGDQFEIIETFQDGKATPYIELKSTSMYECVIYSKIYNHYIGKNYYVEASFNSANINKLKDILLTYYNTFNDYGHFHSAFNVSQGGLSWIGYDPINFVKTLQNQNIRYARIKKKFGDDAYIHHSEVACFIDEMNDVTFYINTQPENSSDMDSLSLNYFNVGFIFNNIPFNHIYHDFFEKIKCVPDSLTETNEDLTQTIQLKNIVFEEEDVIASKMGGKNYVSGVYGSIPPQLKNNKIINKHD